MYNMHARIADVCVFLCVCVCTGGSGSENGTRNVLQLSLPFQPLGALPACVRVCWCVWHGGAAVLVCDEQRTVLSPADT